MKRKYRLTIRLSKDDLMAVDAFADAERLPTSTLARRLLLLEAERRASAETSKERYNNRGEADNGTN